MKVLYLMNLVNLMEHLLSLNEHNYRQWMYKITEKIYYTEANL